MASCDGKALRLLFDCISVDGDVSDLSYGVASRYVFLLIFVTRVILNVGRDPKRL